MLQLHLEISVHSVWCQSPRETEKKTAQIVGPSEENKTLRWTQPERKDSICAWLPWAYSVWCKLCNSRKLEKNLAGGYITAVRERLLEVVGPVCLEDCVLAGGLQTYLNVITHHGMLLSFSSGNQVSRRLASSVSGIRLVIKKLCAT